MSERTNAQVALECAVASYGEHGVPYGDYHTGFDLDRAQKYLNWLDRNTAR